MHKRTTIGFISLILPFVFLSVELVSAQSRPGSPRYPKKYSPSANKSRPLSSRAGTANRTTSSRTSGSLGNRSSRSDPRKTSKSPLNKSSVTSTGDTAKEEKTNTEAPPKKASGQGLRGFIKRNYLWILGGLAASLAGVFAWFTLNNRSQKGGESFLESLDAELEDRGARKHKSRSSTYSSTRISASDVNDRLGGTVSGTEVETDREYALVVEEEALKRPLPGEVDERTGKEYVDDSTIRNLLNEKNFDGAYEQYCAQIEEDGESEFHDDVENAMSEHFLRERKLQEAAVVLEHHVATHAKGSIEPQVYFNLGYIHFLTKTYNKSRRFLRLFAKSETDPRYVARAESILDTLDKKLTNLN